MIKSSDNVKFSTIKTKQEYDCKVHYAGEVTLGDGCKTQSYGPLLRDYNVIRYCLSGQGLLTINNKKFPFSAGQCYVVMAGDVVTETCVSSQMSLSFVTLLGSKPPVFFNSMGISAEHPFLPWKECPEFAEMIKSLILRIGTSKQDTDFIYCAEAYLIFHKLQQLLAPEEEKANTIQNYQEQYISDAMYYMKTNFTNGINVSDVASHIGINRSYFYSLFKKHTGISPQEHLTRLRIRKACELFEYPNSTAISVANTLGLEPSVFFKHFKRITGKTPSEYKQR